MPYNSEGWPCNSAGVRHKKRGPEEAVENKVDRWFHVCYDSFFGGPVIFIYTPKDAVAAIESIKGKRRPYWGTRKGSTVAHEGHGYNLSPEELKAKKFCFTPNPKYSRECVGKRAELDVADRLEASGYKVIRKEDMPTQLRGVDLEASKGDVTYTIDVKSREPYQGFPLLCIQTHETNTDKRIE